MPQYNVRGVKVEFPFAAYEVQQIYMERVIEALQERKNALLESPTGTGKTLCLLTASLAWLNTHNNNNNNKKAPVEPGAERCKIIYASRTHSQLTQLARELKATAYRPAVATLGSRSLMCVHPKVSQKAGNALNAACRAMVSKRACAYHDAVESKKAQFAQHILDIEELVQLGRDEDVCPYYMSRELEVGADLVLMPYNYLLDPSIRRQMKMSLRDCVVILDEAHNVENICADAASFELDAATLTNCVRDLDRCHAYIELAGNNVTVTGDEVLLLKRRLLALEAAIARRLQQPGANSERVVDGVTYPGADILALFGSEGLEISYDNFDAQISVLERVIGVLTEESDMQGRQATSSSLHELVSAVYIAFRGAGAASAETTTTTPPPPPPPRDATRFYRVHVAPAKQQGDSFRRTTPGATASAAPGPTLNYWCFNPGLAMEDIAALGVRSIIVTSGTLAPLSSFAAELSTQFQVRLENPHVIDREQIFVAVLKSGPDGKTSLDSTFANRNTDAYRTALGQTLVNFMRVVPRGMLCFFSSYTAKDECFNSWQQSGAMAKMRALKEVCSEERGSAAQFAAEIERYYASARKGSGGLFFGVCRGKASEGIDFADHNGRAVVITGLPFANSQSDAKVKLKMRFMDELAAARRLANAPADSILTGRDWYSQQAVRAVNQAIGRVIRHRNDWGAILLCDPRFGNDSVRNQLSRWLRPHVKVFDKFADCQQQLAAFLRTRPPEPDAIPTPPRPTAVPSISLAAQSNELAVQPGAAAIKRRLLPPQGHVSAIDDAQRRANSVAAGASLVNALRPTATASAASAASVAPPVALSARLAASSASSSSSSTAAAASKSTATANDYLNKVRQTIGDEYGTFKKLMTDYRANNDYDTLIRGVRALLSGAGRVHLLSEFGQFLKPDLQERFRLEIANDVQTAMFGAPIARSAQVQPIDKRSFDLVLGRSVPPVRVPAAKRPLSQIAQDDEAGPPPQ
jgi:regulator of telomere elongation helicase 1